MKHSGQVQVGVAALPPRAVGVLPYLSFHLFFCHIFTTGDIICLMTDAVWELLTYIVLKDDKIEALVEEDSGAILTCYYKDC